jgi:hypothetical protein
MANKIEIANNVVVESGFKQIEASTLFTGLTAANSPPAVITDGVALGDSYGGIVIVKPGSSDTCDARVWLYFNAVGDWVLCSELEKTGLTDEGDTWKVLIGGADRLYVELTNVTAATGIDGYFLRSYS